MKTLIISSLIVLLTPISSFASYLECQFAEQSMTIGLDYYDANCGGTDNKLYRVRMRGIGPSISLQLDSAFLFWCPTATHLEGTYYGTKANVGVSGGLKGGVVVGPGGRTCLVGGIDNYAAGLGVTINKIEIRERRN